MAEDLTTWDLYDPLEFLAVTASSVVATNVPMDATCKLCDYKGVSAFQVGSLVDFTVTPTAFEGDYPQVVVFAVSDVINTAGGWVSGAEPAVFLALYAELGNPMFYLFDSASSNSDFSLGLSLETPYYCTYEWLSLHIHEVRIYYDAARTSLYDSVSVSVTTPVAYDYVWATNAWNVSGWDWWTYTVADIEIGGLLELPASNLVRISSFLPAVVGPYLLAEDGDGLVLSENGRKIRQN